MLTIIFFLLLSWSFLPVAQDSLTLEYCYSRVETHYPLANKIELREEITRLNKKIAGTASYPQVSLGVSAIYQSEVAELPFPSGSQFTAPELSKDQYRVTLDVSQSIYNGGAAGIKQELEQIQGDQQQYSTEIQLHQLKEQVNQVYFGIILAQQQLEITGTALETLRHQIENVQSQVDHGTLLPSQLYILQAELVETLQDSSGIYSNIKSGYAILSQLIGEEVTLKTPLKIPDTEPVFERDLLLRARPEFSLFNSRRETLDYQKNLAGTNKTPSLSAFGTAAYGRPGYNVFEDDLHPYYILGLRMQWSFWGARNAADQQQVLDLQQKNITEEERAFERQLTATLTQIRERIETLQGQIIQDEEIVNLREKVVEVVSSQMNEGAATATEYVTELNKATQARLSMKMHQTQLEQAKIDYQTALGIFSNP